MGAIAPQITIVYSSVYSDADQRKHESFAPLAFVRGIHRSPVNSRHKGLVTRKMFPVDDVIMMTAIQLTQSRGWARLATHHYAWHNGTRSISSNPGHDFATSSFCEIWWRHQMEAFSAYWPFVRGIHRSRWIPRTKASDAELWWFLWSAPE